MMLLHINSFNSWDILYETAVWNSKICHFNECLCSQVFLWNRDYLIREIDSGRRHSGLESHISHGNIVTNILVPRKIIYQNCIQEIHFLNIFFHESYFPGSTNISIMCNIYVFNELNCNTLKFNCHFYSSYISVKA